jgi:hypothetical protein
MAESIGNCSLCTNINRKPPFTEGYKRLTAALKLRLVRLELVRFGTEEVRIMLSLAF